MAPPEQRFPVGDLELRVQSHTVDFKEKSRKLGNFDLKRDCELLELVQYSCTTPEQQYRRAIESPDGKARMECFPFVRLFRKYAAMVYVTEEVLLTTVPDARRTARSSTSRPPRGKANMLGIILRPLSRLRCCIPTRRDQLIQNR